jgi:restriction endonuclease S subunit
MNEIISKIKDLYEALVKATAKADAIAGHQTSETARLDGKETSLNYQAVELSKREEAVKKVEGIALIKDEGEALKKESLRLKEEMANDRKVFLESIAKDKAEIAKSYKDIEASLVEVKRREDVLKSDREKLEKEKLSFKNDIIKSFDRK